MSEPKRTGLLELLRNSSGCQFVIPVYQRNYTWSADEQVKQYLQDMENVLKGQYKNHFLGIIIYLEKSIDFSAREFSVIDGQQRLTTTFLMIYAIKQILEMQGETDMVNQLVGQYLTNPFAADNIKYKLKPLVSDDDVYRCIVEDRQDEIEDVNSNVLKNYKYISSKISEWVDAGHTINEILMAMDKLYVVCVPISDDDNAQKIFESINATGAKLTAADLIRNYLLMDLQSDVQEDYYAKYWKKLEDNVSQDSKALEMFFRMYLSIKTFSLIPRNSVYRAFMDWVTSTQVDIQPLFIELLDYAKMYNFIYKGDISTLSKKLRDALMDFRKINSDLPLSIVMDFCRLHRSGEISEDVYGDIISSINAYLLRRSICDMNSQNISKLFPTILKKVLDKCNGDYSNVVQILNQEMVGNNAVTSGSYMPTDKQMVELLHLASVYKRPALRIVLDRMELEDNPAPVDLSSLSIEHLMPQTPSEEWLEELDTDMDTYQANIHRLGNLTLASRHDNSKMGNLLWDYKNKILEDTSHLKMNVELLSIEKWNLDRIEQRTAEMIAKICELYPYPDVKIVENEIDIVDESEALEYALSCIGEEVETIRKGSAYKSLDGKRGYIITSSKMYPQGNKEKYWFAYREKRYDQLADCDEKYMILACRNKSTKVVRMTKYFLDEYKVRFNSSVDDEGNVKHYHIVLFINPDSSYTLLLSHPELEEFNINDMRIGE